MTEDMTDILRYSNIAAAGRVLERAGREELLEILISRRYRLYDKNHGGGLSVGKDYENKALTSVTDPLKNPSHGATAMQVVRFFYLLDTTIDWSIWN